jgi:hypothetical protein
MAMKKTELSLFLMLPTIALTVALCFTTQLLFAQSAGAPSRNPTAQQQQQPMPPDDQSASAVKTFSGKIMKSGNKIVLVDADNKTTYQLDDQQKAQDFLNKTVKVTGSLDASTGTIRVTAIDQL